jgi:FixJ family two-component response regulator
MLTGHGSIRTGIEAMKLGAEDFLEKPVDIQHLLERIKEAKNKRVLVLQEKSKDEIRKIILSKPW